jgi:hypothetical protein
MDYGDLVGVLRSLRLYLSEKLTHDLLIQAITYAHPLLTV